MAELNLKQIVDKLNTEFTGEHRKLVFWYDEAADFADDIDSIELENAKIYKLTKDNQFYTKYFLERMDKTTNYLIYAPFPKPNVRDNHLEDTLPSGSLQIEPLCYRLIWALKRSTSQLLKSISNFLPIKFAHSDFMISRLKISMRRISLLAC